MNERILPFWIAAILLISMSMNVMAHEVPDLESDGSITFIVNYKKEPVDGGSLTLYRVGNIVESNGGYSFEIIEKLDEAKPAVDNTEDPQLGRDLAAKAAEVKLTGITAPIEEGEAVFTGVEPGLYVVAQREVAEGFEAMSPFLISMPKLENGVYVTDVRARPKVSLEKEPPEPEVPEDPALPQTGQLNWPVPVLAVSGAALFLTGWILYNKHRKKENYEK